MEDGKKLGDRLAQGLKLRKDQCLIVILAGILLCVIALPVQPKNSKSDISNIKDATIDYQTPAGTDSGFCTTDPAGAYAAYWEESLEDALRYVEGVGKVKVLITLKGSGQKIVEKDDTQENSQTQENDSAGGSRVTGENRIEKSTVYTVNDKGQNIPYVVSTIPPAVEGVVVIAQGAHRQGVEENIIDAIQVLFDIDANKIKIVKMKNNQ